MSSETRIESVFQETGKRFGYEDVTVEITDFRDFKAQWKRSYGWIAFRVSDYIEGIPEPVIRDLAEALFGRIAGKDCGYGRENDSDTILGEPGDQESIFDILGRLGIEPDLLLEY